MMTTINDDDDHLMTLLGDRRPPEAYSPIVGRVPKNDWRHPSSSTYIIHIPDPPHPHHPARDIH